MNVIMGIPTATQRMNTSDLVFLYILDSCQVNAQFMTRAHPK